MKMITAASLCGVAATVGWFSGLNVREVSLRPSDQPELREYVRGLTTMQIVRLRGHELNLDPASISKTVQEFRFTPKELSTDSDTLLYLKIYSYEILTSR